MSAIWLTFRNFFLGRRGSEGYCRYFGHKINKLPLVSQEARQIKTVISLYFAIIKLKMGPVSLAKGKGHAKI